MLIKLIPASNLWSRLRSKYSVNINEVSEAKVKHEHVSKQKQFWNIDSLFIYIIGLIWNLIHDFCGVNFERIMGKTLFHKATAYAHITCFCICFIGPTNIYFISVTHYNKTPIIWINDWLYTLIFLSQKLRMWRSFWVLIYFANLFSLYGK